MTLYLLSRPQFCADAYAEFLRDECLPPGEGVWVEPPAPAEQLVETAGRVCYMSYGKGRKTTEAFIENLLNQGHYSVLEHANWSILITGVSRSLTHELVRHRHFSFSQLSQRYVDESEAEMIMPASIKGHEVMETTAVSAFVSAKIAYKRLVANLEMLYAETDLPATEKRKLIRQTARAVLPNAIETKIVVTGNARTWREFIQKRATPHADTEIRELATRVRSLLVAEAPAMFRDLEDHAH